MTRKEKNAARAQSIKLQNETLDSFKKIGDDLWLMEYKCSYNLDKMLEKGCGSIMDAVRFLQKELRLPGLYPNTFKDGFACSTFNCQNEEGKYIFGRNFDYKKAPTVVMWSEPENGYKSISVIDSTMFLYGTEHYQLKNANRPKRIMGAPYMSMDGINEKGFSCAVLEIKSKATKQNTGKKPIITTVAIRAALDRCETVDEAIELFSNYDMHDSLFINYHYQFADAYGNSAIIEYVDNKMHVIRQNQQNECLALTNYFLTPGGDNSKGMGEDRYERITQKLKETDGRLSEDDAMKLLSECVLDYTHKLLKHPVITLWSAVYNCTDKSMLLCVGMDYDKKYKFYVDRPGKYEVIS